MGERVSAHCGTPQEKALLSDTIIELPNDYLKWLNAPEDQDTLARIRQSVDKGTPFGAMKWVDEKGT